jgi:hypothetical protein
MRHSTPYCGPNNGTNDGVVVHTMDQFHRLPHMGKLGRDHANQPENRLERNTGLPNFTQNEVI